MAPSARTTHRTDDRGKGCASPERFGRSGQREEYYRSGDLPPLKKNEEIDKLEKQVLALTRILIEKDTSRGPAGGNDTGSSRDPSHRNLELVKIFEGIQVGTTNVKKAI